MRGDSEFRLLAERADFFFQRIDSPGEFIDGLTFRIGQAAVLENVMVLRRLLATLPDNSARDSHDG